MRRKSYWANVFRTSYCWWMLLLPPPTYYRIGRDLFRTSPNYWRHRTFDISSYLWSIGITIGRRRMGHVHAGNMYWSRRKEAKESLCDSLTIMLSFESGYAALTHHEWKHCWGCLQRHPTIPRGQIRVDKQRLARLSRNAARFAACKNATCQSSIGYGAWLR
jgi:hypothetical protein